MTELEPLLTVDEVADLSKRTPAAIRKAVERGQVPGVIRPARRMIRFRAAEIRRWLNGGSVHTGKGRASA